MKFGELAELIYLNVVGGEPTPDNNIWREDIKVLLPLAISTALSQNEKEEKILKLREARTFGFTNKNNKSSTPFRITPVENQVKLPYKVQLTGGVVSVHPVNGNEYIQISIPSEIQGIGDNHTTFYYLESRMDGHYLVFINLGKPVCEVVARVVLDFSDVSDDSEITISQDIQFRAMELCKRWFQEQRLAYSDEEIDGKDEVYKRR